MPRRQPVVCSLETAPLSHFLSAGLVLYDHVSAVGRSQEQRRGEKPMAVLQGKHQAQLGYLSFSNQIMFWDELGKSSMLMWEQLEINSAYLSPFPCNRNKITFL